MLKSLLGDCGWNRGQKLSVHLEDDSELEKKERL